MAASQPPRRHCSLKQAGRPGIFRDLPHFSYLGTRLAMGPTEVLASAAPETRLGEAAFAGLYPGLRKFAGVIADCDIEPDDLVQDALVGLLRLQNPRIDNLDAYLRTAMVNALKRRRRQAVSRFKVAERAQRSEMGPERVHYPSDLQALLQLLPPSDRAVLYLLDVERVPVTVAANIVGCSVLATRSRASRARRALRQNLKGSEPYV